MTETPDSRKVRGQQIKSLFDQCLDLAAEQQIAVIAQADVPDEVKTHVAKLLRFTTDDIELTQAVVDTVQVSLDIKPVVPGMKIGAYELLRPIGEGGQGQVWLGNRSDGNFNHQAAIKLLKPMHDQKDLLRFQGERELLASLKHPNIAQLLDGGALGENRPYMILEYVEGLPLLEYGKINQFGLKKYLKCFLQICDAVSYAHSHSIIHRDIKPSNIYVTHDGTVKLLDFGIAKFIDKDDIKTQTMPVMTLAYSSPEQVTGAPVSTATDVYGLGLLLYEMLTGQRAQAVSNEVPAELMHEITQQSPVLPSHMLDSAVMKRRYQGKQLKGDLDNLILMAVRKEPERRYPSVEAMANDVKNFLDGKPLQAVGDGWLYSAKKFIGRNPMATLLTVMVLGFMVALPVIQFENQRQLEQERDKALASEAMAQEQTTIANRTTDFLISILESASPLGSQGEPINLDDVLRAAERQLAVGLDSQPVIKATLISKLASIQHQLGHHDKAVAYFLQAFELYQSKADVPGQVVALGQASLMSYFANDESAALKYQSQAETLSQQLTDIKDQAWHQVRMATIDSSLGKNQPALQLLETTLQELESRQITDPELIGRIYNELSIVTEDQDKALYYINRALDYAEALRGKMHPLYQNRLQNKGQRLKNLERYQEAEAVLLQASEQTAKLFGKDHPEYANVQAELGALYHDKGRFTEVEKIYSAAIDISFQKQGESSLNYVLQINNLAYLYEDMNQYDQAEQLYRESVRLRKKYHSNNPIRVASSQSNLARLLAKSGQFQESQKILHEIMPVFEQVNRSSLQNHITAIANLNGHQSDSQTCVLVVKKINEILPELTQLSEKSWRRMQAELWLGEMALQCHDEVLGKGLLEAAVAKAKVIYDAGSYGRQLISAQVNQLLRDK